MKARNELLADLADDVRELTEPRTHSEMRELVKVDGHKRTRVRERHTETHPSLLESLRQAARPGQTGEATSMGGFESRPPADLEPIRVLRAIEAGADHWCNLLGRPRATLNGQLAALVGADHTDQQLAVIHREVSRWVREARIATGWDAPSTVLNVPCPNCWARNTLTVNGDLDHARCAKCRQEWGPDMIGILSQMLTTSETQTTVAGGKCNDPNNDDRCYLVPEHADRHVAPNGRWWPRVDPAVTRAPQADTTRRGASGPGLLRSRESSPILALEKSAQGGRLEPRTAHQCPGFRSFRG